MVEIICSAGSTGDSDTVWLCVCVCVCASVYVCTCVCLWVGTHTHTHTHTRSLGCLHVSGSPISVGGSLLKRTYDRRSPRKRCSVLTEDSVWDSEMTPIISKRVPFRVQSNAARWEASHTGNGNGGLIEFIRSTSCASAKYQKISLVVPDTISVPSAKQLKAICANHKSVCGNCMYNLDGKEDLIPSDS